MALNAASLRNLVIKKLTIKTIADAESLSQVPTIDFVPGTPTYAFVDTVCIYFVQFIIVLSKDMTLGAGPPPGPAYHLHSFTRKHVKEQTNTYIAAVTAALVSSDLFGPVSGWSPLVFAFCTEVVNVFNSGQLKTDKKDGSVKHIHIWSAGYIPFVDNWDVSPIAVIIRRAIEVRLKNTLYVPIAVGRIALLLEAILESFVEYMTANSDFSLAGGSLHKHDIS